MQYGQQILLQLQYLTDLQFGLRARPTDLTIGTYTADTKFFYYGIQADNSGDLTLTSAQDLDGNSILSNYVIPAGGRLDGAFSQIVVASGKGYTQYAPEFDVYTTIS
jgi:hypothetical protein